MKLKELLRGLGIENQKSKNQLRNQLPKVGSTLLDEKSEKEGLFEIL